MKNCETWVCLNYHINPSKPKTYKPMKAGNVFLVFVTGAVLGAGGHWYLTQPRSQELTAQAKENMRESSASVRESAVNVGESLKQTFDPENIKEELARTGKVIREQAA